MKEQTNEQKSYLTFKLGDELFAVSVNKVLEILEIPRVTKIPRAPDFMRGVINLRGSVLPVIDSRAKFGLPAQEDDLNTCIIVVNIDLEGQNMGIGLIVDAVQEVMEIEPDNILAAPSIGSRYKSQFMEGMVKVNEQFVMILDLVHVFSTNDVSIFQELAEPSSLTPEN